MGLTSNLVLGGEIRKVARNETGGGPFCRRMGTRTGKKKAREKR